MEGPTHWKFLSISGRFWGNSVDFEVIFDTKDDYQKRELFSIEKIKEDMGWYPKYNINKGIEDLIKNLGK